jgi:hypothetical protein
MVFGWGCYSMVQVVVEVVGQWTLGVYGAKLWWR